MPPQTHTFQDKVFGHLKVSEIPQITPPREFHTAFHSARLASEQEISVLPLAVKERHDLFDIYSQCT